MKLQAAARAPPLLHTYLCSSARGRGSLLQLSVAVGMVAVVVVVAAAAAKKKNNNLQEHPSVEGRAKNGEIDGLHL